MASSPSSSRPARVFGLLALPVATFAGFAIAFVAVIVVAFVSWQSLTVRSVAAERVSHTLEFISQAEATLSAVKDAETGQRGYLLTGAERYLEPYTAARNNLPTLLKTLRELSADSTRQLQRVDNLESLIAEKISEMGQTIDLRRAGKADEALALVATDRGKSVMDRIRATGEELVRDELGVLQMRQADWQEAARFSSIATGVGAAVLLSLIAIAALTASRDYRSQRTQAWIRAGQIGTAEVIAGEQRIEEQGDRVLAYLAQYVNAQVGAFYIADDTGTLRRTGVYALGAAERGARTVADGSNLLAQATKDGHLLHVRDVPAGYLTVSSALGSAAPSDLLIAPASVDGVVHAVVELGFFRRVDAIDEALLGAVADTVGVAIRNAKERRRVQELLAETQQQAEELQTQQEELRVGNEELEEQGKALKESQAMLETQQAELEQTNSQLSAQAHLLERQNDALTAAQQTLNERAHELERLNQVKGEFLANMSHELRTPLNSTLILARLLADNKEGNLSAEQVKFAQTISGAGNDLLALINDILDLSKLEAGKVEVAVEPVSVGRLVDSMRTTFEPVARDRKLALAIAVEPSAPATIATDAQRLAQVLRNLLANALKFTERGEVSLRVFSSDERTISFAVRDTGVGIQASQRDVIFEAFRQADGSTHRKYGGTGLGLSISRDLARLLGGDIALDSKPGLGSTFTLTLPRTYAKPADDVAAADEAEDATLSASAAIERAARSASAATQSSSRATPGAARAPATPDGAARGIPRSAGTAYGDAGRAAAGRADPDHDAAAPGRSATARSGGGRAEASSGSGDATTAPLDDDRDHLRADARLILVIEDDERFAAILRDLAHERGFQCVVALTANDGLAAAQAYRPSAIVLDMNLPDHSGMGVLDQLKRNPQTRHVPVHVVSAADLSREALERGAVGYALKPVLREDLVDALKSLEARMAQQLRRVLVVEDDPRQLESIVQLLGSSDVEIVGVATGAEALDRLGKETFDCMVTDLQLPDVSGDELLEKMAARDDVSFPPVIVYTGRTLTGEEEQKLRRHSKSIIVKDARSPERLLDEVTLFLHQVESTLPPERQRMLREARHREQVLEGRRVLVVEDDVRNIFALSSVLEPKGARLVIARNGKEAIDALEKSARTPAEPIDIVLMDIMMPEMDGYTAMREIRKRAQWKKLPIIALTAKAMKDDQEKCLEAGANDYIAKPLDVEKLLSLLRVWMPK